MYISPLFKGRLHFSEEDDRWATLERPIIRSATRSDNSSCSSSRKPSQYFAYFCHGIQREIGTCQACTVMIAVSSGVSVSSQPLMLSLNMQACNILTLLLGHSGRE